MIWTAADIISAVNGQTDGVPHGQLMVSALIAVMFRDAICL